MSDPAREHLIAGFLAAHGYAARDARPLAQDASFRRYLRLKGGAVLMDAPPPEDVRPFLRIAAHLARLGLSVPRILAADEANGLVIEEDLGDALFPSILTEANADTLFDAAIDALIVLQRAAPPAGLPVWGPAAMRDTALGTLFDWWWPAMHGGVAPEAAGEVAPGAAREVAPGAAGAVAPEAARDVAPEAARDVAPGAARDVAPGAAREAVASALATMLAPLETGPRCLVHRDFFAGNLLWLPDRTGPRRAGVIDFQGAAMGHPAYDLVSLLQDARRDIPAAWEARAIARYLASRPDLDPEAFRAAYDACAAQRHLRVACQWVRLARRDGRPHYLAYGPRTWGLLARALTRPAAAPLAAALDRFVPASDRRNPPGLTA